MASTGTGSTTTSGGGVSSAASGAALASLPGGGFTDSQNAARIAAQAAAAPTINLTVNGAIDAEGTARTIVNTLNDSYYRGTGGAGALQAI
jgi:hypothetical protein